MKYYTLFPLLLLLLGLTGCGLGRHPGVEFPAYAFTIDTLYPATPVKHQGRTSNCWAYAMASLFETEWIMQHGDTIELSPEYIVRCKYHDQFENYCSSDSPEPICQGGLGHTFLHTFHAYGILPWGEYDRSYRGRPNYRRLLKQIRLLARMATGNRERKDAYRSGLERLLDAKLGTVPDSFRYQGRDFTPQSFAQGLPAARNTYIELTSFSNKDYHSWISLDLSDNWERSLFYNVPLDELTGIMASALQQGCTFVWDGDVSEPCFSMMEGLAFYPPEFVADEQARLDSFLAGTTTDDHMMHIVGLARNREGERFFIAKNSYGSVGPHGGYVYLSERYVRMKTVSILVSADIAFGCLNSGECRRTMVPRPSPPGRDHKKTPYIITAPD